MKYLFLVTVLVFSVQEVFMCFAGPPPCEVINCEGESDGNKPVCGKQKVGDCWEVKIFNSSCLMQKENSCNDKNYVPCAEENCEYRSPFDVFGPPLNKELISTATKI